MYNVKDEKRQTSSRCLSTTTNRSFLSGSDHINITEIDPIVFHNFSLQF